jgi:single-strand DNA-binding protein
MKQEAQMIGQIPITVSGNLTDAPQLRCTANGVAVASFTVATTERVRTPDGNEWKDGETVFLRVDCWRTLAENVAESLAKGSRVMVSGTLRARPWEDKEGGKRTSWEIRAEEVGASLVFATADIHKRAASSRPVPDDPWASEAPGE